MEWGYRNLPRRLLAEPLLRGPDGASLAEAQVFTFHGRAAIVRVRYGVKGIENHLAAYFDAQGNPLPMAWLRPHLAPPPAPEVFQRLISLAESLSAGFSHLRVDFHLTADGPMVGELTTYTGAGTIVKLDGVFGRMWAEMPQPQGGSRMLASG